MKKQLKVKVYEFHGNPVVRFTLDGERVLAVTIHEIDGVVFAAINWQGMPQLLTLTQKN
jgi:hypothetical protein